MQPLPLLVTTHFVQDVQRTLETTLEIEVQTPLMAQASIAHTAIVKAIILANVTHVALK